MALICFMQPCIIAQRYVHLMYTSRLIHGMPAAERARASLHMNHDDMTIIQAHARAVVVERGGSANVMHMRRGSTAILA